MHIPASARFYLFVGLLLGPAEALAVAPPPDPITQAQAVLERHCQRCHGDTGRVKGGLEHITDLHHLVQRGLVVPGKPQSSPLYQRIHDGEMPPAGKRASFNLSDQRALQQWIIAGAPTRQQSLARLLTETDALRLVCRDLESLPPRQRRFLRYLTLGHLANKQTARAALAKVVNSLSWHARLTVPAPIDPGQMIYRIDLRHYRWTARQWDKLAATYPYRRSDPEPLARQAATLAGCEQPLLRGDWFIATASRPPAYHDFLQLPTSDRSLERLLQVDVPANLDEDNAVRAGFNGSGVARSNRLLERHDALHGAYWRSYDFSDNTARQNLFEYPLGPMPGPAGFRHAGGEIIFHLPNGLQGYMLVDGDGRRIDRAPGEIVSDPKRPDKIVENGLSCIGCHVQGIIPKDDQVRGHVLKNPRAFTADQRESILALYAPAARLRGLVKEDNDRFAAALKRLRIPPGEPEPVASAVLRYEEVLDLGKAAAEVGVTPEVLTGALNRSTDLARPLGPLLARGGSVQRQVFEEAFPRLLQALPAKRDLAPRVTSAEFRHQGTIRALAWSRDGKAFASAAADGTVRVHEVATGRSRQIGGSLDEPQALAFSPDGNKLLIAGADRVVLLYEIATNKRLARLVGHTAGVRSVAITPDGRQALSAGADRSVRVWDLRTNTQARVFTGHTGTITALSISSDGKNVLSAGTDRSVRLWQLATGKLLARFDHPGEVHAVAFSPDGKRIFTGGSDRGVSCHTIGHKADKPLAGHAGTVVSVALLADGSLLAGCTHSEAHEQSLRCWNLSTKQHTSLGPIGPIEAVAVNPDGLGLLASRGVIRLVSVRLR